MLIGERIKYARKIKGMSQAELGEKLGVTKVSVCGYEKGTRTPTVDKLLKLVEVLDLDAKYVLGLTVETTEINNTFKGVDYKIITALKENEKIYSMLSKNPKKALEKIEKLLNKK